MKSNDLERGQLPQNAPANQPQRKQTQTANQNNAQTSPHMLNSDCSHCRVPQLPAAAQTQSEHVRSRSATLMQHCCTHEKQKKYDRQNDKADACDMNTLKLSGCVTTF